MRWGGEQVRGEAVPPAPPPPPTRSRGTQTDPIPAPLTLRSGEGHTSQVTTELGDRDRGPWTLTGWWRSSACLRGEGERETGSLFRTLNVGRAPPPGPCATLSLSWGWCGRGRKTLPPPHPWGEAKGAGPAKGGLSEFQEGCTLGCP